MNLNLPIFALGCLLPASLLADDWDQYRGPGGRGISAENSAPLTWDAKTNIKWRKKLPSNANSSPIVSKGRVFVTCAAEKGKVRSLLCFHRKEGTLLWTRSVRFEKEMPTHSTNPYCASTPVANGELVVVWHGSAGIHCYDFEGKTIWSQPLGEFEHIWGYASSPIIHDNKVILHAGPGKRVYLCALDLKTGNKIWETDELVKGDGSYNEKKQYIGSWSTPVVTTVDGQSQIVCAMSTRVNGYNPTDGKIIWSCDGLIGKKGELAYSSPVIANDICLQIGGFGGPSLGFKMGGTGNITEKQRLWHNAKNPQNIGSGVFAKGHVFVPDAASGSLRCIHPATGKETWRVRTGGPNFWGSISMVANRCYVTNQEGETIVFAANPAKFEKLAANNLAEACNSTPAISDGEIFIRTSKALYCIAE